MSACALIAFQSANCTGALKFVTRPIRDLRDFQIEIANVDTTRCGQRLVDKYGRHIDDAESLDVKIPRKSRVALLGNLVLPGIRLRNEEAG